MKKKLIPCLWFDGRAEEAAKFYVSVFKGRMGKLSYYPEGGPGPKGSVLTASFTIRGQEFLGLNGGPQFRFNESVSFQIPCKDQKEIDYYWEKLTSGGGQESMCGWLKDKYGLSWQVFPDIMPKLLQGPKASQVMQAFMKMRKFDIAAIKAAAKGSNEGTR